MRQTWSSLPIASASILTIRSDWVRRDSGRRRFRRRLDPPSIRALINTGPTLRATRAARTEIRTLTSARRRSGRPPGYLVMLEHSRREGYSMNGEAITDLGGAASPSASELPGVPAANPASFLEVASDSPTLHG